MSKKRLIIIGLVVAAVVLPSTYFLIKKFTTKKIVPPAKVVVGAKAEPAAPPAAVADSSEHLRIEKISVDTKIVQVGLTKAGDMDVPGNIYDVGWYNKGTKIGSKGTAVLAGHLDGAGGEPGVFAKLNQLSIGDVIKIILPDGKEIIFKVTKTKQYGANDKPTEVFTSSSGTHLNLITCTGSWDKNKSQYDKRLVVFTDLVK